MADFVPVAEVEPGKFVPVEEVTPAKFVPVEEVVPETPSLRPSITAPGEAGPKLNSPLLQPSPTQAFPVQQQTAADAISAGAQQQRKAEELAQRIAFAPKSPAAQRSILTGVAQPESEIQPIGQERSFLRGATSVAASVLNRPEYLAALANPATAVAVAVSFLPGVAKQFTEDLGKAAQGDNEALGRAAAIGIPALVGGIKGGKSITERLAAQTQLERLQGASNASHIDAMARQELTPKSPEKPTVLPLAQAELNKLPGGKENALPLRSSETPVMGEAPGRGPEVGARVPEPETSALPQVGREQQPQPAAQESGAVRDVTKEPFVPVEEVIPNENKIQEKGLQEVATNLPLESAGEGGASIPATTLETAPAEQVEPAGVPLETKPAPPSTEQAPETPAPATAAVSSAKEGVGESAPLPSATVEPSTQATASQAAGMSDVGPAMGANVYGQGGEPLNAVSNMKAAINQDRVARGEPPMPETDPRSWTEDQAIAEGRMRANPDYVPALIRDLLQRPRPLSSSDVIAANLQRAYWQAELRNAWRRVEEARRDGREADQLEAQLDADTFSGRLNDMDRAFGTGGGAATEAGRALNAQQAGITDDLDIVRIRMEKETALGRPLQPDEVAALQKQVDEYKAAKDALAKELDKATAEASKANAERLLTEIRAQNAEKALPPPQVLKFISEVRKSVKSAADESRDYFKGKVLSLSVQDLYHLSRIALDNLLEVGEDFGKWSAKMAQDLGAFYEQAKPKLQELFDRAREARYEELEKKKVKRTPGVKKAVEEPSPAQQQAKIVAALKESAAEGVDPAELKKYIRSIVETVIEDGEMEHHAIFQKTGDILREAGIDLTEDQMQRIYGGYGEPSAAAPSERVPKRMAELRGEAQKFQGLKTVIDKNTPPLSSGGQPKRVKPSDLARRTAQQIHEEMKARGVATQTTESQLAGALDARKNFRRNRMKDLRHEMATGKKIVGKKNIPLTDPELETLDAEYQQLKREHAEAFPKQPLTDEQRVAMELKGIDREIASIEEANKRGEVMPEAKLPRLSTPELEARRARLEAVKAQRDELRSLSDEWNSKKETETLERNRINILRQIDAKEKALAAGAPAAEHAPIARPAHPEIEPLLQQRDELSRQISEARKKSPDVKAAEALQRRLDAINKNVAELQRKIATKDISTKGRTVSRPLLPELEIAMQEQQALQKELREMRKKPADVKAEEALQRRVEAANKRADEVLAKIATGDISPERVPVMRPLPPELEAAKQRLEAANKQLAELRKKPVKSRDVIASEAAIRYAKNKIAEMQGRIALGYFEPLPKRAKPILSPAAQTARAEMAKVKLDLDREMAKYRLSKRGLAERVADGLARWKLLGVLSYPTILGKLTAAAGEGIMFGGVEGVAARGMSRLLPKGIREGAIRYGRGTTLGIETDAFSDMIIHSVKNFKDALKTGNIELDLAYGKPEVMPKALFDWIGNIHYALKTPLMQNEWARSFKTIMRNERLNGTDVTNPAVMERIKNQAYRYARERLFLEDNRFVDAYKAFLRRAEQPDSVTGKVPPFGKALATAARFELPIVRIPTNLLKRTFEHTFGIPKGLFNLGNALRKGVDTLSGEEKDVIVRNLSRGSVGAALLLYGWFNADNVGGYYQASDKPNKNRVKYGGMKLFGVEVPRMLLHNPALESVQFGATAKHVFDKMIKKHENAPVAMSEGAWAALMGLTEETPFVGEIKRQIRNSESPQKAIGEMAKSTIPGFVQWAAGRLDLEPGTGGILFGTPRARKPSGAVDVFKMGLPGYRNEVPLKPSKPAAKAKMRLNP